MSDHDCYFCESAGANINAAHYDSDTKTWLTERIWTCTDCRELVQVAPRRKRKTVETVPVRGGWSDAAQLMGKIRGKK